MTGVYTWDMKEQSPPRRRQVCFTIPDPEVHAKAATNTSVSLIDQRLEEIKDEVGQEAADERAYLLSVRYRLSS